MKVLRARLGHVFLHQLQLREPAREAEAETEAEETRLLQLQFQIVLQTYHITRGSITSVTAFVAKRMCCDFSHM